VAIDNISTSVKSNTVLNTDDLLTNGNLSALQWATGTLLNNEKLALNSANYIKVDSMFDIGMNFMTQPEITRSGCDATFTYETAAILFNQNQGDTNPNAAKSILSPTNYFNFQELYETSKWTSI